MAALPHRAARLAFAACVALLTTLAGVGAPTRVARADGTGFAIKNGDRVVFFGDSITEQRLYSRYVQEYVHCRYPDLDVRFWNAGWGGDTAAGALARADRDVVPLKPTLVTLFFGMNDGGYKAKDDAVVAEYRSKLAALVAKLKGAGARVIVFTPGCVDLDHLQRDKGVDYNATLDALARAATAVAKEGGCEAVDLYHAMLEYQTARKSEDAGWTMLQDGIHPNAEGHLLMTRFMLEGLGAEPMPALGSVDLTALKGEGIEVVKAAKEEVELTTTAPTLVPMWVDGGAAHGLAASGLLDRYAGQSLTIAGLAKGDWTVSIDGQEAGTYDAADFARGLKLPGTWSARGHLVHDLIERKEASYFHAWREVAIPLAGKVGVAIVVDGLMTADQGYTVMIREQVRPETKHTITLVPAPDGPNLARGKTYWASDFNNAGWNGGLTDGSWEFDAGHCFATGDDDRFPKHVTIDLGQTYKVSMVKFGVPDFGSTRTVEVSVAPERNNKWKTVGTHEFALRKKERWTETFTPTLARYVRLTYKRNHQETVGGYSANFCFTPEVEVYGGK